MLFNSYEFIFAFLPVTLALFFLAGAQSQRLALTWLTLASLFFYAWWRPFNVLIIGPSLLVNYLIARALLRPGVAGKSRDRWLLAAGIAFNLAFLGYFKYANFAASALNDLAGTDFVLEHVVLPLGISFITFQKIAFLIDVHSQRIKSFTFGDYCLFVLFFPQLIAGPIVHYREMMPQFEAARCRLNRSNLAVGLTLFVIGLFKKVVLADGIAGYVTPVFAAAAAGETISLLPAWIAALGFTLQIYFDFSGYSDMALGLGRLFGVKLPVNFDSPLKATSIIDFWLRWHVTLTRFLTAYVYNPLVLWLTRRRLARQLPVLGGRNQSVGAFVQLLAAPTLLTMLLSGLWHGAGYFFLLWGLMHGVYLVINHAWRLTGPKLLRHEKYEQWMPSVGFVLTFLAVVIAMVVFRAPTLDAAVGVFEGMVGYNGLRLPSHVAERLAPLAAAVPSLVVAGGELERTLMPAVAWIGGLSLIALALPNSLQIMAHFEPATSYRARPSYLPLLRIESVWRPTLGWAAGVCALAVAVIMRLGGKSEFLYWQF
jgi:D-alanyl-lipoteichoic acid acyltransferase DltB (MBOAT superfamily)